MNKSVIYKNKKDEGYTPKSVVNGVKEYLNITKFDCDPSTTNEQALKLNIEYFYSKEYSGLEHKGQGNVGCNPPFSLKKEFVLKAIEEVNNGNCKMVAMLLPMSMETKLGHEYIFPNQCDIIIPKGHIKFESSERVSKSPAFASCIVIFKEKPLFSKSSDIKRHILTTSNFIINGE